MTASPAATAPSHPTGPAGAPGRFAGPGIVLAANVGMIAWTWPYCPDPVIDFGREAYIPWMIVTHGQVLYRDINYFDGPLGIYVLAAAFAVFGASLAVLKLANAAITLALAVLIYGMILRVSDAWAATVAGVTFAVLFACAQLSSDPCFNFLTPYSHNLTYGVALSLAMVACLGRAATSGRAWWLAGAGVLLGLVCLTKAEVMLAALIAAAAAVVSLALARGAGGRGAWRRGWRDLALLAGCAALPVVAAWGLLSATMPAGEALAGIAGAWKFLSNRPLMGMSYFRWVTGLDQPAQNLWNIVLWAGRYGALVAAALALAWLARRWKGRLAKVVIVLGAAGAGLMASFAPLAQAARPLALFLLVILARLGVDLLSDRRRSLRVVLPLTLSAFALALLSKSILRVNLHHYGFALSLPAVMVLIAAFVGWLPRTAAGRDAASAWAPRTVILSAWGVAMLTVLYASDQWMRQRIFPIGEGADQFLADDRGRIMELARRYLKSHAPAGSTMTAIPDGSILNYLLRMPSSVRFHNFLPPEVVMFGEQAMLEALRAHPPDWIVLIHADTSSYDARFFGRDYGLRLAEWISSQYEPAREPLGAWPYTGSQFGVLILRPRAAASGAQQE